MDLRPINNKLQYNHLATHVIQSWEWGEFRKSLGLTLLRYGIYQEGKLVSVFQLTLHKIPFLNKYVGYLPKGPQPDIILKQALEKIGKQYNCAFIKIEPNITTNSLIPKIPNGFIKSPKPLFTKYNFVLDLTKPEDEILKGMSQKTRYNIKIAQKHKVVVYEGRDQKAFETYLKLYFDTTKRQGYHGHNKKYHEQVWSTLNDSGIAKILIASYQNQPLTAWMLLNFKDTLYYPYGGSLVEHREVMANNLVAWEAIKMGKKLGLKKFDMWGALGPNAKSNDPWYGFHKFKQGYGGELVEYIGTFDLVLNWPIYILFSLVDMLSPLKFFLLKILHK